MNKARSKKSEISMPKKVKTKVGAAAIGSKKNGRGSKSENDRILQLHVSLVSSKPLIWRRILVRGSFSLWRLHQVLQRVMGWEDSHLHEFIFEDKHYGRPDWDDDPGFGPRFLDERKFKIGSLFTSEGAVIRYFYDFGDGWEHDIKNEAIKPYESSAFYPRCIDGANDCPPEDSGGLGGYYEKLRIINDPKDPEYEEILEWMSGFPPKPFSLIGANLALLKSFRSKAKIVN